MLRGPSTQNQCAENECFPQAEHDGLNEWWYVLDMVVSDGRSIRDYSVEGGRRGRRRKIEVGEPLCVCYSWCEDEDTVVGYSGSVPFLLSVVESRAQVSHNSGCAHDRS